MNLNAVFALFAIAALTLSTFICMRINRRKVMCAERMMRSLELAIRAEATLLCAS
jgi:hypothetical protein